MLGDREKQLSEVQGVERGKITYKWTERKENKEKLKKKRIKSNRNIESQCFHTIRKQRKETKRKETEIH